MINTEKAIKFLEDQELTQNSYPDDDLQEHIARQMQKYADQQLILSGVGVPKGTYCECRLPHCTTKTVFTCVECDLPMNC